jgi:hypothetical protein
MIPEKWPNLQPISPGEIGPFSSSSRFQPINMNSNTLKPRIPRNLEFEFDKTSERSGTIWIEGLGNIRDDHFCNLQTTPEA